MTTLPSILDDPFTDSELPDQRRPPGLLKQMLSNRLALAGFVLLGMFALIAIFAPLLAPPLTNARDPMKIPRDGFSTVPLPPGSPWVHNTPPLPVWWRALTGLEQWTHPFGVASGGWDIYYGVIWGTRTAFLAGIVITFFTMVIGILLGTVSGYYGGRIDTVLQRLTEVFLAFPFLMAALTAATVLQPIIGGKAGVGGAGLLTAGAAIIIFGWMGNARLIRGDILSIRERDYVMAARAVGARDRHIMLRHIVPNAIFPTIVISSLNIGTYAVAFASLSFLGLGAEQGFADWGQLLAFARNWITALDQYWYMVFFPGMALILFVLTWNLVGDAVRDILDPRMRQTR